MRCGHCCALQAEMAARCRPFRGVQRGRVQRDRVQRDRVQILQGGNQPGQSALKLWKGPCLRNAPPPLREGGLGRVQRDRVQRGRVQILQGGNQPGQSTLKPRKRPCLRNAPPPLREGSVLSLPALAGDASSPSNVSGNRRLIMRCDPHALSAEVETTREASTNTAMLCGS